MRLYGTAVRARPDVFAVVSGLAETLYPNTNRYFISPVFAVQAWMRWATSSKLPSTSLTSLKSRQSKSTASVRARSIASPDIAHAMRLCVPDRPLTPPVRVAAHGVERQAEVAAERFDGIAVRRVRVGVGWADDDGAE